MADTEGSAAEAVKVATSIQEPSSSSSLTSAALVASPSYSFREVVAKRDFSVSDCLRPVVIGDIEPKHASKLLISLSEELPLARFGLDHLKRIKKCPNRNNVLEILLYANDSEGGVVLSEEARTLVSNIRVVNAARYEPCTREEFGEWGQHWPIIFRPSELNRDRERGLPSEEADALGRYVDALDQVEGQFLDNFGIGDCGCIIINPLNGKIVANSYDGWRYLSGAPPQSSSSSSSSVDPISTSMNALYTPTMICIEIVAAIVREDISCCPDMLGDDHYLCTGLDLYTTMEPDLMSSMGLVHSRIRRVFYRKSNEREGSLGTHLNIHDMRELNHRFRVYKIL